MQNDQSEFTGSMKTKSYLKLILFYIAMFAATSCALLTDHEMTLVADGQSDYVIVVSSKASKAENRAADELQSYISEISGCQLYVGNSAMDIDRVIYVGFDAVPDSLIEDLDADEFGKEEYIIRVRDEFIIIAGGAPRGTLYGVTGFLRDYLGCRWYTRDLTHVPKQMTVRIPTGDRRESPFFADVVIVYS